MKEIIIADLIPLKERGTYMGIIALVWALSATGGPPIGGVFAKYNWRWMFCTSSFALAGENHTQEARRFDLADVNVPLAGIALILVALFLHVKTPKSDFATKMKRMDWLYVSPLLTTDDLYGNSSFVLQRKLPCHRCHFLFYHRSYMGRSRIRVVVVEGHCASRPWSGGPDSICRV